MAFSIITPPTANERILGRISPRKVGLNSLIWPISIDEQITTGGESSACRPFFMSVIHMFSQSAPHRGEVWCMNGSRGRKTWGDSIFSSSSSSSSSLSSSPSLVRVRLSWLSNSILLTPSTFLIVFPVHIHYIPCPHIPLPFSLSHVLKKCGIQYNYDTNCI